MKVSLTNAIDKVNSHQTFLHRQDHFLTPPLPRLLYNALILFLIAYTALFPNLSKKLKVTLSNAK